MQVELRHFRHFVEVADCLNFTRAAERLGVTTQAVSASIRRLERALGCQLLWRDTHNVALTDEGERLLAHAREVLAAADAAVRSVRASAPTPATPLRLGASPVARYALLPSLLDAHARQEAAEHAVREEYADPLQDALLAGGLDAALLYCPRPRSGLRYELLCREPAAVALAPDHAGARSPSIPLRDLREETFLLASSGASGFNAQVIAACRAGGFEPTVMTDDLPHSLAFDAVREGRAVTVGCAPALHALAHGCVVVPLEPPLYMPWELAWPADGATAAASRFIAVARKVRDDAGWLLATAQRLTGRELGAIRPVASRAPA